ncbi:hypothetical protein WA158_005221 [Blastocystis sp. Blastoise]
MSDDTYHPKNILVTGGAGFIASHIVILLCKKYPECKIVNFDVLDYCASLKNVEEVANYPNYKFVKGNIMSAGLVNYVLETEQIDTIMHFAAQSHVDNSFGNSLTFTYNNVVGTHILLESARVHNIKRFIHVSTDEVYGEQLKDQDNVLEEATLNPTNPYAATKAAAEFICKGYLNSFKMPIIITRSNNIYGPHQYPEKVIPKFINLIERGKKLPIHGTGENMRTFLYVKDVAKAFDLILHKGKVGSLYNISGPAEISVKTVALTLLKLMKVPGNPEDHIDYVRDRMFNDYRYAINSSKLEAMGWKPETLFEDGLKETLEWYLSHRDQWDNIEVALEAHPSSFSSVSSALINN